MSEEQIGQLYQLMHVTKDLWKPIDPASEGGEHPSWSQIPRYVTSTQTFLVAQTLVDRYLIYL